MILYRDYFHALAAIATLAIVSAVPAASAEDLVVESPNGRNRIGFSLDASGQASYRVVRDEKELILPSPIGLALDSGRIGAGMAISGHQRARREQAYAIVAGNNAQGMDRHNELSVDLTEANGQRRRMRVILRAYDDGVALRTELPVQPATSGETVRGESTEFRLTTGLVCRGFNVGRFDSSHEGEYDPVDQATIRPHHLFDLPFVCENAHAALALAESDLLDFPSMYLAGRSDGLPGLQAKLSPMPEDKRVAVRTRIGQTIRTPWRVIMLTDRLGRLNESTLITDLATPSRIADTHWIKPGKTVWDWWNGPTLKAVPGAGSDTATAKAYIDFAAANKIAYSTIDEGWYAGAGGGGTVRPGANVTGNASGFDLEEVAHYAHRKGVGLWLWVNWRALDAQMEEAMALYQRLGIAGIKIDFMDRGDHEMVRWYEKVLETAARHELMVNLHGAFVPRGLNRTYPNFVTQEGVLGAEYNKWTHRVGAAHNVMLAYSRGLLGPMDYTPGGFVNVSPAQFRPHIGLPEVMTTRAHGLAMYVVYDSPLVTLADSPDTYRGQEQDLAFLREVPTRWDETRFLGGETAKYIVLAKRRGEQWFLGAMNDGEAREVRVPLPKSARACRIRLWQDGERADATIVREIQQQAGAPLALRLAADGGAVAIVDRCA